MRNSMGGWFKFKSRVWLADSEIRNMSRLTRLAYVELLNLANEVNYETGEFKINGTLPMSKRSIIDQSFIEESELDQLISMNKVTFKNDVFSIVDWVKWRSESARVTASRNSITAKATVQRRNTKDQRTKTEDTRLKTEENIKNPARRKATSDVLLNTSSLNPNPSISPNEKKAFITFWNTAFEYKFGKPYFFQGAKDHKAVEKLIETYKTQSFLEVLVLSAWNDKNDFLKNNSMSIAGFQSVVNRVKKEPHYKELWDEQVKKDEDTRTNHNQDSENTDDDRGLVEL